MGASREHKPIKFELKIEVEWLTWEDLDVLFQIIIRFVNSLGKCRHQR
jgi:hypothetical protein